MPGPDPATPKDRCAGLWESLRGQTGSEGAAQVRLTADQVRAQLSCTFRRQVIDHPWLMMGQIEQDNVLLAQAGPKTTHLKA